MVCFISGGTPPCKKELPFSRHGSHDPSHRRPPPIYNVGAGCLGWGSPFFFVATDRGAKQPTLFKGEGGAHGAQRKAGDRKGKFLFARECVFCECVFCLAARFRLYFCPFVKFLFARHRLHVCAHGVFCPMARLCKCFWARGGLGPGARRTKNMLGGGGSVPAGHAEASGLLFRTRS